LWKKWRFSIRKCKKSGDHPQEDLAKSGYNSHMTYRTLIILLYLWLHAQNQTWQIGDFNYFFSLLAIENLQNHFFFNF
jgi:hypothetical protein